MTLDLKAGSYRARRWWRSWQIPALSSFWSGVKSLGMNFAAGHVQIRRYNCLHCFVWHINDGSNVINGSPTNCFHILEGWARGRSPRLRVVIQWCSAALEACVPLETTRTDHCFIAIQMSNHVKSLSGRFTEFDAEFDVRSLSWFAVHDSIVVIQTPVAQHTMFTQNDATWYAAWWRLLLSPTARASPYCHLLACYRSISKPFDTTSCVCVCVWEIIMLLLLIP